MAEWVMASKVGFRIRDLRIALGLKQWEFGEKYAGGVDDQTVSNWERGRTRPEQGNLELIALRAGLPLEIFAEGGPMPHTLVNSPVNEPAREGATELHARVESMEKALREALRELEFLKLEKGDMRADLDEVRTELEFYRTRDKSERT